MKVAPEWDVEGCGWPHRLSSRFVFAAGIRWHVQMMGQGPVLLLIHGTGAATHSWRLLAPMLADQRFTVVSMDLPGHGFTDMPAQGQFGLHEMSVAIGAMLRQLCLAPQIVVGHSAGAAIAIRMTLDGVTLPRRIVSLNGALLPFPGMAAVAFPALAKLLFLNPLAAPILAWRASEPGAVERLIAGTGSRLDAEGIELYARLFRTRRHAAAAVGMMAKWDLLSLKQDLPKLAVPLELVTARNDRAVPPADADILRRLVKNASVVALDHLGHLAHEENPSIFADIVAGAMVASC